MLDAFLGDAEVVEVRCFHGWFSRTEMEWVRGVGQRVYDFKMCAYSVIFFS